MTDFTKQVDELLSEWDKTTSPGCAIAIIQNGEVLYKRGYGMANLELNVPITPSSLFYLASVSKQFTAMAIALLTEMGKIALTDELRQYLPELPDFHAGITIEHVLRHTSGLRDYFHLGKLVGKRIEDVWTENELLEMLSRQRRLNFPPGDEYMYSNSGYVLLTIIIKRITGESMQTFAEKHIFKPLGMNHTLFKEDHQLIIPNRVSGYSRKVDGGYVNEYHNLQMVGDSGLYSNVEDLSRWDQNFYHNRLGKGDQALIDLMHTTRPLNDGTEQMYALGLEHYQYRGLKVVTHGGNMNGARTVIGRFPEQNFTVICLSNLSDFDPEEISSKIVDIYLADDLGPSEREVSTKAAEFDEQDLENLRDKVGIYHNPKIGVMRQVKLQDDQLVIPITNEFTVILEPLDRDHFKIPGFPIEVRFKPIPSEDRFQLIEIYQENPPFVYEPVYVANPTSDALLEYCGRYHSDELDTNYRVEVEDGKLILRHNKREDTALQPTVHDGFNGNGIDIYFRRNKSNSISGFSLYTFWVRNIHFAKTGQ